MQELNEQEIETKKIKIADLIWLKTEEWQAIALLLLDDEAKSINIKDEEYPLNEKTRVDLVTKLFLAMRASFERYTAPENLKEIITESTKLLDFHPQTLLNRRLKKINLSNINNEEEKKQKEIEKYNSYKNNIRTILNYYTIMDYFNSLGEIKKINTLQTKINANQLKVDGKPLFNTACHFIGERYYLLLEDEELSNKILTIETIEEYIVQNKKKLNNTQHKKNFLNTIKKIESDIEKKIKEIQEGFYFFTNYFQNLTSEDLKNEKSEQLEKHAIELTVPHEHSSNTYQLTYQITKKKKKKNINQKKHYFPTNEMLLQLKKIFAEKLMDLTGKSIEDLQNKSDEEKIIFCINSLKTDTLLIELNKLTDFKKELNEKLTLDTKHPQYDELKTILLLDGGIKTVFESLSDTIKSTETMINSASIIKTNVVENKKLDINEELKEYEEYCNIKDPNSPLIKMIRKPIVEKLLLKDKYSTITAFFSDTEEDLSEKGKLISKRKELVEQIINEIQYNDINTVSDFVTQVDKACENKAGSINQFLNDVELLMNEKNDNQFSPTEKDKKLTPNIFISIQTKKTMQEKLKNLNSLLTDKQYQSRANHFINQLANFINSNSDQTNQTKPTFYKFFSYFKFIRPTLKSLYWSYLKKRAAIKIMIVLLTALALSTIGFILPLLIFAAPPVFYLWLASFISHNALTFSTFKIGLITVPLLVAVTTLLIVAITTLICAVEAYIKHRAIKNDYTSTEYMQKIIGDEQLFSNLTKEYGHDDKTCSFKNILEKEIEEIAKNPENIAQKMESNQY